MDSEVFLPVFKADRIRTLSYDSVLSENSQTMKSDYEVDYSGDHSEIELELNNDVDVNSDSEGGLSKDSGVDSSPFSEDLPIPDDELIEKVKNLVEYYFSDEAILKDPFLLKHVRRNKEGYVSLKLIASFRKVKSLSKNWKVVAHCLKLSTILQVNDEGTKVKRLAPLPNYDETVPSRTIVAFNLPTDKQNIEAVGEMFSKCGEISLIRILRPGCSIPADVKKFVAKYPDIASTICALIEFEKFEAASKAIEETQTNNTNDWRSVRVLALNLKNSKNETSQEKGAEKKKKKAGKRTKTEQLRTERSSSTASSGTENESPRLGLRSRAFTSTCPQVINYPSREVLEGRRRSASQNIPQKDRQYAPGRLSTSSGSYSEDDNMVPWVRRKWQTRDSRASSLTLGNVRPVEGVICMPRGPDGTKGFNPPFVPLRTCSALC